MILVAWTLALTRGSPSAFGAISVTSEGSWTFASREIVGAANASLVIDGIPAMYMGDVSPDDPVHNPLRRILDRMNEYGSPYPAWNDLLVRQPDRFPLHAEQWAFGWPCLCLMYDRRWGASASPVEVTGGFDLGSKVKPGVGIEQRVLPYRPIWPGLAANLAAFSIATFFLLTVPWALRRESRRRRNRCVECGYSLDGLRGTSCPECGHAVSRKS